jgi:hypothetical protein
VIRTRLDGVGIKTDVQLLLTKIPRPPLKTIRLKLMRYELEINKACRLVSPVGRGRGIAENGSQYGSG